MIANCFSSMSQFNQLPANNIMGPLVNNQLASNSNVLNNLISPMDSASPTSSTNGEGVTNFCNNNNNNNRTPNKNNMKGAKKDKVCPINSAKLRRLTDGKNVSNLEEIHRICSGNKFRVYPIEKKNKYKCKKCKEEFKSDYQYYAHYRTHFTPDKLSSCEHCHFVTELKHHFHYHVMKHWRLKPLKCDQCDYICCNKGMIDSHVKAHADLYFYNCQDCKYSSKYCHSMKKHLRKEKHRQGMTFDKDGKLSDTVIDVYGSRRGPKTKSKPVPKQLPQSEPQQPPTSTTAARSEPQPNYLMYQQQWLNQLSSTNLHSESVKAIFYQYLIRNFTCDRLVEAGVINPSFNVSSIPSIQNGISNGLNANNSHNIVNVSSAESAFFDHSDSLTMSSLGSNSIQDGAIDLSKSGSASLVSTPEVSPISQGTSHFQGESVPFTTSENPQPKPVTTEESARFPHICQHCNMAYGNIVLFTLHMGTHGADNPFTCNICGEVTNDSVHFATHIMTSSH